MAQRRENTMWGFFSFPAILLMFLTAWAPVSAALGAEGATEREPGAYMRDFNRELDKSDSSSENSGGGESSGWVALGRMFGALALVVGLIFLAAWLTRRYGRFASGGAGKGGARTDTIRIVGTKMLGGRRSLMLVRVRGQTLLLGVTPQSINCLTEIHEIEGEWAQPPQGDDESQTTTSKNSAFQNQLGRFVNQVVSNEEDSTSS